MSFVKRLSYSKIAVIILLAIIITCRFSKPLWNEHKVIAWDVFGYYLYLPAVIIHGDPKLENQQWIDSSLSKYPEATPVLYQANPGPLGNRVIYYTCGLAVLNLPGFLAAHAVASVTHYPADGLSLPYQLALILSGLFYTVLGLVFARKVLLRFFGEATTSIVLLAIGLGTNYFFLTAFDGAMPHNYVFALYAIIVYFTIRWHERQKGVDAALLGATLGVLTIARGTEIIAFLIPALWGIKDKESLKAKLLLLKAKLPHILLVAGAFLLAASPQLIYWKISSGKWIYNSYGQGRMIFEKPYLWQVLFSFKKGWLVYTPMMIFSLIGFISLYKRARHIFFPVILFFIINLYIVSCWDVWWGGASFGQRYLMQSMMVLSLPLGFFLQDLKSKKAVKWLSASVMVFFLWLNLFQTWQFFEGILDGERMTREYYFASFGKTKVTDEERALLEHYQNPTGEDFLADEKLYSKKTVYFECFETPTDQFPGDRMDSTRSHSGKFSYRMDPAAPYSPGLNSTFEELSGKDHAWIRTSCWIYSEVPYKENPSSIFTSFTRAGHDLKTRANTTDTISSLHGTWTFIQLDYLTPFISSTDDIIKSSLAHRGVHPVWIDDLKFEVLEKIPAKYRLICRDDSTE